MRSFNINYNSRKNVTSIDFSAFRDCNNLNTVTIESADVYNIATSTSNAGELLAKATTIKVRSSIDDGSNTYLNDNFTKTTEVIDGKTYNVYTK